MFISNFQAELRNIDSNLSIVPNPPNKLYPEVEKLASIQYMGQPLFAVPANEIFDERNESYGVDVRGDGRFVIHRTRPEALAGVRAKLEQLKDPDYLDAFLGRGVYSEAELRRDQPPTPELVEEVKSNIAEIKSEPVLFPSDPVAVIDPLQAGQMAPPPKSIDEKINDKQEPVPTIGTDPIQSMIQPSNVEESIKQEKAKVSKSIRPKKAKKSK